MESRAPERDAHMFFLDLTLSTPAENIACDQALLEACDLSDGPEVLRVWEPTSAFVVLGYANRATSEANLETCRAAGIPVLRRITGGGAVLQAPGCLNYALVLRIDAGSALAWSSKTNAHVMERHRAALERLLDLPVTREGATDLAVGGRKVSGNSQRRRQRALLFHGSFLLDMDISIVRRYLPLPTRAPDYRAGRPHETFLTNLSIEAEELKQALRLAWGAWDVAFDWPRAETKALVRSTYSLDLWNLKW